MAFLIQKLLKVLVSHPQFIFYNKNKECVIVKSKNILDKYAPGLDKHTIFKIAEVTGDEIVLALLI